MTRHVLLLIVLAGCAASEPPAGSEPTDGSASPIAPPHDEERGASSSTAAAPDDDDDDEHGWGLATDPASPAAPAAPAPAVEAPRGPLLLHYGFLQAAPIATNTNGTMRDPTLTAKLLVPNADNVIVSNLAPSDPAYDAWRAGGGRIAYRQSMVDLVAALPEGDPIEARLAEGFDYVAIDELEPSKAADVKDGAPKAHALAALFEKHPHQIILYANSYNMAGSGTNLFSQWKTVLGACRDHGRALASQVYLATTEAFAPGTPAPATCATGTRCYSLLANAIDAAAPGIATKVISVIDTRGTNLKAARADSYCGGKAALKTQLGIARGLGQRGAGTYALTYVANDVPAKQYATAVNAFAACWIQEAARFPQEGR